MELKTKTINTKYSLGYQCTQPIGQELAPLDGINIINQRIHDDEKRGFLSKHGKRCQRKTRYREKTHILGIYIAEDTLYVLTPSCHVS